MHAPLVGVVRGNAQSEGNLLIFFFCAAFLRFHTMYGCSSAVLQVGEWRSSDEPLFLVKNREIKKKIFLQ